MRRIIELTLTMLFFALIISFLSAKTEFIPQKETIKAASKTYVWQKDNLLANNTLKDILNNNLIGFPQAGNMPSDFSSFKNKVQVRLLTNEANSCKNKAIGSGNRLTRTINSLYIHAIDYYIYTLEHILI